MSDSSSEDHVVVAPVNRPPVVDSDSSEEKMSDDELSKALESHQMGAKLEQPAAPKVVAKAKPAADSDSSDDEVAPARPAPKVQAPVAAQDSSSDEEVAAKPKAKAAAAPAAAAQDSSSDEEVAAKPQAKAAVASAAAAKDSDSSDEEVAAKPKAKAAAKPAVEMDSDDESPPARAAPKVPAAAQDSDSDEEVAAAPKAAAPKAASAAKLKAAADDSSSEEEVAPARPAYKAPVALANDSGDSDDDAKPAAEATKATNGAETSKVDAKAVKAKAKWEARNKLKLDAAAATEAKPSATKGGGNGGGRAQGTGQYTGSVKSFIEEKGFGFIVHQGGGDVFFRGKDMVDGSVPDRGDTLRYDVEDNPGKPGALKATNVTGGSKSKGQKKEKDHGGKGDDEMDELRVIVKGLPFDEKEAGLRTFFSTCGEITNVKFLLKDNGLSKGVAFINFATKDGAKAALQKNGDKKQYPGRTLNVDRALLFTKSTKKEGVDSAKKKTKKEADGKPAPAPAAGFNAIVTKDMFAKMVRLQEAKDFSTLEDMAAKIVKSAQTAQALATVQRNSQRKTLSLANTVFVKGLPSKDFGEDAFKRRFADCGPITFAWLPLKVTGESKGFGTIRFKTEEAFEKALKYNGTKCKDQVLVVQKSEGRSQNKADKAEVTKEERDKKSQMNNKRTGDKRKTPPTEEVGSEVAAKKAKKDNKETVPETPEVAAKKAKKENKEAPEAPKVADEQAKKKQKQEPEAVTAEAPKKEKSEAVAAEAPKKEKSERKSWEQKGKLAEDEVPNKKAKKEKASQ